MKYLILIICLLMFACGQGQNTANQNTTPTPSPKPELVFLNMPEQALESFLNLHYKGWELKGDNLDESSLEIFESDSAIQFDAHLIKGQEEKVITLIIRQFQDKNGAIYWQCYEPTKLEIARRKLQEFEERVKEQGADQYRESMNEMAQDRYDYDSDNDY